MLRAWPSVRRASLFYKSYIPLGEAEPEGRPSGGATSYSPRCAGSLPTLLDPTPPLRHAPPKAGAALLPRTERARRPPEAENRAHIPRAIASREAMLWQGCSLSPSGLERKSPRSVWAAELPASRPIRWIVRESRASTDGLRPRPLASFGQTSPAFGRPTPIQPFLNPDMDGINRHATTSQPSFGSNPRTTRFRLNHPQSVILQLQQPIHNSTTTQKVKWRGRFAALLPSPSSVLPSIRQETPRLRSNRPCLVPSTVHPSSQTRPIHSPSVILQLQPLLQPQPNHARQKCRDVVGERRETHLPKNFDAPLRRHGRIWYNTRSY